MCDGNSHRARLRVVLDVATKEGLAIDRSAEGDVEAGVQLADDVLDQCLLANEPIVDVDDKDDIVATAAPDVEGAAVGERDKVELVKLVPCPN